MVGARKLLKVLHMTRMNHSSSPSAHSPGTTGTLEADISEDSATCRACLNPGSIPIYGNYHYDDVSRALNIVAGIHVKIDDYYPKFLCDTCNAWLEGAIMLRKVAQQSDRVLRTSHEDSNMVEPMEDLDQDYSDEDYSKESVEVRDVIVKPLIKKYEEQLKIQKFEKRKTVSKKTSKPAHCDTCNIDFKTEKEYTQHKHTKEHLSLKANCPVCNKEYNAIYLKQHLKYTHSTDVTDVCDICGKEFTNKYHFESHRRVHTRELPIKCGICPYRCRFKYSMTVHMRIHTGERPYSCPQCPDRAFIHKSNLNRHLLTHKAEKEFSCNMCQKGFHFKAELESHIQVHHIGIKNHLCNLCGKAFGKRSKMLQHQVKVHKRKRSEHNRMPLYLMPEYQHQE